MDKARFVARLAVFLLIVLFAGVSPVRADYDAGRRAWDAGRPDEALSHWRAAADAGDRRAMLALGRLYRKGLGVPQNYVEAHKWLNLAASRGEAAALEERDALAAQMTPAQAATAQERAAQWQPGETPAGAASSAGQAGGADTGDQGAGKPPTRAIGEAQALLAELGYTPGPTDGIWGRRTAAAYSAFLADAGLPLADVLTPAALRAMRAVAKSRGGEAGTGGVAGAGVPRPSGSAPARPAVRPDALHRAARAGDLDGLKVALEAGAEVDARDGGGRTALMHAVDRGYVLLIQPLLAAGANPDERTPDGATALFIAAVHEHVEIISELIKGGANPAVKGPKNKTAVDVARDGQNMEVILAFGAVALEPKCPQAPNPGGTECWMKITNKSGCYLWNSFTESTGEPYLVRECHMVWGLLEWRCFGTG